MNELRVIITSFLIALIGALAYTEIGGPLTCALVLFLAEVSSIRYLLARAVGRVEQLPNLLGETARIIRREP